MADRKTHEYDTEKKLGVKGTEVHKMMDSMFRQFFHRHRFVYHHREGIEMVAKRVAYANNMDYDLAKMVAECHVRLDFDVGYQLPIPSKYDYIGGEGDWPTTSEYTVPGCPWDTDVCDKNFRVTKEIIDEVHRRLEDVEESSS